MPHADQAAETELLAYYKSDEGKRQIYDTVIRSYTDVGEKVPFEEERVAKEIADWRKALVAALVFPDELDEFYTAELISHTEKRRISVVDILRHARLKQAQKPPEPIYSHEDEGAWNEPPYEVRLLFERLGSGKGAVVCDCQRNGHPVAATLADRGVLCWVCSMDQCGFEEPADQIDALPPSEGRNPNLPDFLT